MNSDSLAQLHDSGTFHDHEPVLQSHPLLPDVAVPSFGRTDRWPLHAVHRPANVPPQRWELDFRSFDPTWNLQVREVIMAALNPHHPALEQAGATLERTPYDPATLSGVVSELRVLARWATTTQRPAAWGRWRTDDLRAFINHLAVDHSRATIRNYVLLVRLLLKLAPALTFGGPPADPWPGRSARTVADNRNTGELSTCNIRPATWFSLIKAAWTYVDVFGPDILRARAARQQALAEPGRVLIGDLSNITRPDGTRGPWHEGLTPEALTKECKALRAACYLFVAALSMMRDSEIREITRGAVTEYFGSPAVISRKRKLDPGRPREHWWITDPVARAIATAEALSRHPELVFADSGIPDTPLETFSASRSWITSFIQHVNAHRGQTGLAEIPPGKTNPHMFRKTMAMLVSTEPGSEIALGLQLKHIATRALANRSTQGYAAADTSWATLLDEAIDDAHFRQLSDLYDQHHAGHTIGFGPGADHLTKSFDTIRLAARNGDKRTEYDLLRKSRISLRFGKLNHCAFDESNPAGARCLETATTPPGHTGPLIDRCQPGRCANSVITPDHLKIWRSEETSLLTLLETPNLPRCRRDQIDQQLDDVRSVIKKSEK